MSADLNDWEVCHGPHDAADRVWLESRLNPAVSRVDFPPVPTVVREVAVPAGLVVTTPWAHCFLGLTSGLPTDGWASPEVVSFLVDRWGEQEWAWLVGESYLYQAHHRCCAWVVDEALLTFMQGQVERFPGPLVVSEGRSDSPGVAFSA